MAEAPMRTHLAAVWLATLGAAACGDPDSNNTTVDAPLTAFDARPAFDAPPSSPPDAPPPDAATPDAAPPPDTDVAVVRLQSDGTPDTSFGPGGVRVFDLGAGAGTVRDTVTGLARDGQNRIVIFGSRKAPARADQDHVVVRVKADGTLDGDFATGGVYTLDTEMLTDNARNGIVQTDGKIVAAGYVGYPTGVGAQVANQISLLRLDSAGTPDGDFGAAGVSRYHPLKPADPVTTMWGMVEAYGAVPHNTGYVTTGYGRVAASGTVDVVATRVNGNGALDENWGTKGVTLLDLVGENDRGRNLVALGDDRVVMVGSGSPSASNIDAMVVVLDASGQLDNNFDGDGWKLYSFGRADEAFFGVAVSPDGKQVAAAGYTAGATGGPAADEDGTLLLLPVGAGAPAESAAVRAASDTLDDRYWAVAYDADGRVYVAGQVTDGGDTRMIVARFGSDGARDNDFGQGGVATVNVSVGPGTLEAARGIAITTDGKIVIAGHVERR